MRTSVENVWNLVNATKIVQNEKRIMYSRGFAHYMNFCNHNVYLNLYSLRIVNPFGYSRLKKERKKRSVVSWRNCREEVRLRVWRSYCNCIIITVNLLTVKDCFVCLYFFFQVWCPCYTIFGKYFSGWGVADFFCFCFLLNNCREG